MLLNWLNSRPAGGGGGGGRGGVMRLLYDGKWLALRYASTLLLLVIGRRGPVIGWASPASLKRILNWDAGGGGEILWG